VELPPQPWTANSQVQVVSDNGNTIFYGDDIEAKHLPFPAFKKFRSDWVTFGDIVISRPACYTFSIAQNNATLSWCSVAGLIYRVQSKNNLDDSAWTDLSGDIAAVGPLTSERFPTGPGLQRFFRVIVVP